MTTPPGTIENGYTRRGAAGVLLASEEWAKSKGLPILAYLVTGETAAVDFIKADKSSDSFVRGAEGLLMAPAQAVPRMLGRLGLGLGQAIDAALLEAVGARQIGRARGLGAGPLEHVHHLPRRPLAADQRLARLRRPAGGLDPFPSVRSFGRAQNGSTIGDVMRGRI